jgi:hypothetical protein
VFPVVVVELFVSTVTVLIDVVLIVVVVTSLVVRVVNKWKVEVVVLAAALSLIVASFAPKTRTCKCDTSARQRSMRDWSVAPNIHELLYVPRIVLSVIV